MADVKIDGLEATIEGLGKILDIEALQRAMGMACAAVEASAKQKAPKGNGELRNSIKSKVVVTKDDVKGIVYSELLYAPYVEFGTGLYAEEGGRQDVPWHYKDDKGEWHSTNGMHPQPYMRPALDENRILITKLLKEAIKQNDKLS
jgi:HK97 gp10 family phage protein